MEVTQDKYELPVAVADSAVELSRIVGATVNNIRSSAHHKSHGKQKRSRFVRVEAEDE